MRSSVVASLCVVLGFAPLGAQSRVPAPVSLSNALPSDARPKQLALSADARRVYYTDSAGQIWMYDRGANRTSHLASGNQWDLALSPTGDALAFTRASGGAREQYVWVLALDPRTGLAASDERRISAMQGDIPAISPDGKSLAFARDDTTGVGQSVVIVPLAPNRAPERVLVPTLGVGIGGIRWAPDGSGVYFGVNAPLPCNPEWSCLPARAGSQPAVGTIRHADLRGGPVTVRAAARSAWPGLSPDGSMLVYADTGQLRRMVIADTSGRRLDSFVLPPGQSIEGWLTGATLLISNSSRGSTTSPQLYTMDLSAVRRPSGH